MATVSHFQEIFAATGGLKFIKLQSLNENKIGLMVKKVGALLKGSLLNDIKNTEYSLSIDSSTIAGT